MKEPKQAIDASRFIGKRLNKNILGPTGVLYLPQDILLTERHLEILKDASIELTDTDIMDSLPIEKVIKDAVDEWKEIFQTVKNSDQIFVRSIEEKAVPLIFELVDNYDLHSILSELLGNDDYTYRHSVAVAALSTLIGKWLDFPPDKLRGLTIAALLHDIGKTKIPSYILTKAERLTQQEYQIVKQHTVFGYEMIRNAEGLSELHALVALQHHERLDGSGYPHHLRDEAHLESRIVAVADVFHAMLSKRPYKESLPFYQVVKELYSGAFGLFDPLIVAMFTQRAMEALIGNDVLLSNGQMGKIIQIDPQNMWKPLIMSNNKFINLANHPSIYIEQV